MDKYQLMQYLRSYIQTEKTLNALLESEEKLRIELKQCDVPPPVLKDTSSEATQKSLKQCNEDAFTTGCAAFFIAIFLSIFAIPIVFVIFLFTPIDNQILNLLANLIFVQNHPFISKILLCVFSSLILVFPLAVLWTKPEPPEPPEKYNARVLAEYEEKQARLPNLKQQYQTVSTRLRNAQAEMQRLLNYHVIHPDYLKCASTLLKYLERGRADSLKEAINLYEQEMKEWHRELEERRFRREMQESIERHGAVMAAEAERTADATARAADAAERAASWSATSALIAANEAERKKKRDRG